VVEPSNLNRQYFFRADVGRVKVAALADHLRDIHPEVKLEEFNTTLTPENVARVFDGPISSSRRSTARMPSSGSSSPGAARPRADGRVCERSVGPRKDEALAVRRAGRIIVCGDERSEMTEGCARRASRSSPTWRRTLPSRRS